jgi:hypothetical protein
MKKVNLLKRAFSTIEYNSHQFTLLQDKGSNNDLKRMVLAAKDRSKLIGDASALRDLRERLESKYGV